MPVVVRTCIAIKFGKNSSLSSAASNDNRETWARLKKDRSGFGGAKSFDVWGKVTEGKVAFILKGLMYV